MEQKLKPSFSEPSMSSAFASYCLIVSLIVLLSLCECKKIRLDCVCTYSSVEHDCGMN